MLLIRPKTIDDTTLVTSSVPESEAVWTSTHVYSLADLVTAITGPEKVVNGTFVSATTGWTGSVSGCMSIVGARMRVTGAGAFAEYAYQVVATVIGQAYTVSADLYNGTSTDAVRLRVGTSAMDTTYGTLSGVGANALGATLTFVATTATTYLTLFPQTTAPGYSDYDNVSLTPNTGNHRVYESMSGGTSSTATMTIASPSVVTWPAHGLAANTPILFQTSGALPTGLVANTVYYVLSPTTNTFNVSATAGGAAINTSGSQSGTHIAIANPNKNKPLTDPTFWLDIGPTNRWAMFDDLNGTVTTDAALIDVTMALPGRLDSLALLGLENAVSVRVIASTVADGTVYDVTTDLTSTEGISDWYSWFFEEIERKSNLLLTDLPSFNNPTVRAIITGTGTATLECGNLVIGQSKDLGRTLHDGASVGITDYSRKDVDAFGNFTIVQRAFAKRGSFKMRIAKSQVDGIEKLLSQYRATPAVYSASADYGSTLIWGFFKDFQIEIDYPTESLVSIEIEGLT